MEFNQFMQRSLIRPGYTEEAERSLAEAKQEGGSECKIAAQIVDRLLGAAETDGCVSHLEHAAPRIWVQHDSFDLEILPTYGPALFFDLRWRDELVFAGLFPIGTRAQACWKIHLLAWVRDPEVRQWEAEIFTTFPHNSEWLLEAPHGSNPPDMFAMRAGEGDFDVWALRLARDLERRISRSKA
jgi:hypothetical protein